MFPRIVTAAEIPFSSPLHHWLIHWVSLSSGLSFDTSTDFFRVVDAREWAGTATIPVETLRHGCNTHSHAIS